MSLTVVIPCRDDAQVTRCVGSVDTDAEVIVVLNGSPPGFRARVAAELGGRARVEELGRPNRSRAAEHGVRAASFDHVLIMDSDCVFAPGALAAAERAFERGDPESEVYRGRIVFEPGASAASALVARSRARRMAGRTTAYKPPLALSRRLAGRLGGHVFDARLPWKEDADLDQRVRRAGIRVVPVDDCVIRHAPLSIAGDLRSTFRYGVGAAVAEARAIPLSPPSRSVAATLAGDGPLDALYLLAGNRVRAAGRAYGRARIMLTRGRWLDELARP